MSLILIFTLKWNKAYRVLRCGQLRVRTRCN
jgi:hypothetical protein